VRVVRACVRGVTKNKKYLVLVLYILLVVPRQCNYSRSAVPGIWYRGETTSARVQVASACAPPPPPTKQFLIQQQTSLSSVITSEEDQQLASNVLPLNCPANCCLRYVSAERMSSAPTVDDDALLHLPGCTGYVCTLFFASLSVNIFVRSGASG